ncbi:MAG: efflux RND transporter periplasmic adaptor subunit [Treponema sp.]|nr:efflux RND transporter periplasmic adaptor subunit [Treponema sp.]
MKSPKKFFKISIIVVSLCAVLAAALVLARRVLSAANTTNITYTARSEVYQNVIDIAGVVSAAHEQTLQALSDGTVIAVYVEQGDSVKKGDIIIQLDDTEQQYNLAKHDYDMATTRITGSARQLELMKTQRLALVQKIADRKVTATFNGIIADIDVSVGDSLEAKDSVGTLVDISYLVADVEVAETDVSKLEVGQQVECTFPSYSGTVTGHVVGWPAIGEVTARGATVVKAHLRIDDYPKSILPNFSFSGKIKISPDETFVIVSRYAIGREDGKAFVVSARTGEKIEVHVAPYGNEYVQVLSGLSGGEVLKAQSVARSGTQRTQRRQSGPGGFSGGNGRSRGGPPPGGF